MSALRRLLSRVAGALWPGRRESDLSREVASHLALLEDDFRRRGLTAEEARLAARHAFGGIESAKELHRDARSFPWIDDARRDLRHSLRALGRQPAFTTLAVATLALGVGATTTIFTVVDAVLLRSLPYPSSDRLVVIAPVPRDASEPVPVTPGGFLDWQARVGAFSDMTAFTGQPLNLTGAGEPLRLLAGVVTDRFAETLGVMPERGRTFATAGAGANRAVLLSERIWRERFGADPAVVGRAVTLDDEPHDVIGVMPAGFSFPYELHSWGGARAAGPGIDVWILLHPRPGDHANAYLRVVGRLKPGVTLEAAHAEMAAVSAALAAESPRERDRGTTVAVTPLDEFVVSRVRPLMVTLFGAVALLLVIVCVNLANLLLGRAAAREREAAVRVALGSSLGRLIRLALTESLLLGLAGGAVGLGAAIWGVHALLALMPAGTLPRADDVHVNGGVLAFAVAASLLTAFVAAVLPAIWSRTRDVVGTLRGAGQTHTTRLRPLRALVVAEVTLGFVLLVSAALLVRSFERLTSVPLGFESGEVLAADVSLPDGPRYRDLSQMRSFLSAVLARLQVMPGVVEAGAVNLLPIGGPLLRGSVVVDGVSQLPPGFTPAKPAVSPGYFRTMGIPFVDGRDFEKTDTDGAPGVAIVSHRFATAVWPGARAVGKRVKLGIGRPENDRWLTVVGVVGDVKQETLASETRPALYVPLLQAPLPFLLRELSFVARTDGSPVAVGPLIRAAIHDADPLLPVGRLAHLSAIVGDSVSEPRFRAVLLGAFAMSAIALIAVGLFGVLGSLVARRTREIGLRMALGARRGRLAAFVALQALAMTAIGIATGTVLALPAAQVLAPFLFETSPRDPVSFVLAGLLLVALSLAASYVPARRAARVDPLIALRTE